MFYDYFLAKILRIPVLRNFPRSTGDHDVLLLFPLRGKGRGAVFSTGTSGEPPKNARKPVAAAEQHR